MAGEIERKITSHAGPLASRPVAPHAVRPYPYNPELSFRDGYFSRDRMTPHPKRATSGGMRVVLAEPVADLADWERNRPRLEHAALRLLGDLPRRPAHVAP